MFEKIIVFSVRNRLLVVIMLAFLIGAGVYSMRRLPLDAVPDITNNQVQVVTTSPSLAPEEVERFITFPLELVMGYLPEVLEVRSISRFGLSIVTVVFEPSVPILDARQLVQDQLKLAEGDIPQGLGTPELMPITTGLGEIYQYTLLVDPRYKDQYSAMELRTIQDWIVKRQFAGTEGLVEVSSFGGFLRQFEVAVHPLNLRQFNIGLNAVTEALRKSNLNSGGGLVQREESSFYIRTEGILKSKEEIGRVVVANKGGTPVLVRDLATVRDGFAPRFGTMSMDGQGEVVGGITLMLRGASSSDVIENVHNRVEKIRKSLPEGVSLKPYLDRSDLVGRTIKTVATNLMEGGLIVILVLVILLGNIRAGLIVASVIPLSMLFAFIMMDIFGVSANLMSLGAIDFGIVIDGAVIIVEHLLFVLAATKSLPRGSGFDQFIARSSAEIYRSAAFGVLIILVVFIPILTLQGIEGKMFRPMAQTFGFAVTGALILSLTYVPAVSAIAFRNGVGRELKISAAIISRLINWYRPIIEKALRFPKTVIALAMVLLIGSIYLFSRLGQEFIPQLEEGDLAVQMALPPGSGLKESLRYSKMVEKRLLEKFPEVKHVVSKIGAAEVPTDPMAVEEADIMIILKPQKEWVSAEHSEELASLMKDELAVFKGLSFEFTQPIQLRFNELITGAKTDIAIKIFGDDLAMLADLGQEAEGLIADIEGVGDVKVEQTEGLPQMHLSMDREAMARYGIASTDVQQIIRTAYSGADAGFVFEGQRRFDLVVRLNGIHRDHPDLDQLFVHSADGHAIALSELVNQEMREGPALISREQTQRRINVGVNVRNRDMRSVVLDIQERLQANLQLPAGYFIQYGGEFESLESAKDRLLIVVPIALLLIFLLLIFTFDSAPLALLIFAAVPLSVIGGIIALDVRGLPFSISAGVGFITLFGVSVLNGIVLVAHLNKLLEKGGDSRQNIVRACIERLRPVLITATVATLGFLPMALSTTAGAEVQRPLATVVIGGLVSATLLTLVVLPVLYQQVYLARKLKEIEK